MCQDSKHKYLGFELEKASATIPFKTKQTIMALPPPRSVKEVQRVLGLINYYTLLTNHICRFSHFMSKKLRKNEASKFKWDESDDKKYERMKQAVVNAHMSALVILLDPMTTKKLIGLTDWSKEANVSSIIVLCSYEEDGKRVTKPALCDSRTLPESIRT